MVHKLNRIRRTETELSVRCKILFSSGIALFGLILGFFQKWLDSMAVNELPSVFQRLDITNFFGRLSVWILLAAAISVLSTTPIRAALNTFLFFINMLFGYYLYCNFRLGFLPVSYMMIWVGLSVASLFAAFVCWYAKGKGLPAVIISALILGAVFSQTFLVTQGFGITHLTEVIVFALGIVLLRRDIKETAAEVGLSVVIGSIIQLVLPVWG